MKKPDLMQVDVEDIIKRHIGPVGLWQLLVMFTVNIGFPPPVFVGVFLLTRPNYRCLLDPANESNFTSFDLAARFAGPWWSEGLQSPSEDDPFKNDYGCFRYSSPGNASSSLIRCDRGFVYQDKPGQYPDTITKTWDLICERSWYIPFSNTIYMLGMMTGFLFGGAIGGVYGRRSTIILMGFCFMIAANITSLSYNYPMYSVLRGIVAFSVTSRISCTAVLMSELTLATHRSLFISISNLISGAFLKAMIVALAYCIPYWRWFNFSTMGCSILSMSVIFFVPESPSWLLSQSRQKEARMVLYRGYRINQLFRNQAEQQRIETEEFFQQEILTYQQFLREESFLRRILSKMGIFPIGKFDQLGERKRQHVHRIVMTAYLEMFSKKEQAKKTFLCVLLFSLQVTVSFGLTFYARVMRTSIYLLVLYSAFNTIPGQVLNFLLYRYFKSRKKPLMAIYFLNCVALATLAFCLIEFQLDYTGITTIIINVSLILMQAALSMMFVLIPEMFTPDLRTQGFGVSSGLGRMGGLICDFINELDLFFGHGVAVIVYAAINLLQLLIVGFFLKDKREHSLSLCICEKKKEIQSPTASINEFKVISQSEQVTHF
ncbi:hypothetical protein Ciccas_000458 [Cichlidogyrus casuarinus]|uniref:Major facilitator superfamily (MFS) profile domain-containing protein n=1 Tax=Cichlidogyrus casuarinus TaxID=1844966 RepID=A0ABD2QQ59_9PLAT